MNNNNSELIIYTTEDGKTQVQAVKVRNGFLDKLKWFFSDFWTNIFKAVIDALIIAC